MARGGRMRWWPLVEGGELSPKLHAAMRDRSGVYAIRKKGAAEVLYVGESHCGKLWRTMLRHFQAPQTFKTIGRGSFAVRHPENYEVAFRVTSKGNRKCRAPHGRPSNADLSAIALETKWIEKLKPTINREEVGEDDTAFDFGANVAPREEEGLGDWLERQNPRGGAGKKKVDAARAARWEALWRDPEYLRLTKAKDAALSEWNTLSSYALEQPRFFGARAAEADARAKAALRDLFAYEEAFLERTNPALGGEYVDGAGNVYEVDSSGVEEPFSLRKNGKFYESFWIWRDLAAHLEAIGAVRRGVVDEAKVSAALRAYEQYEQGRSETDYARWISLADALSEGEKIELNRRISEAPSPPKRAAVEPSMSKAARAKEAAGQMRLFTKNPRGALIELGALTEMVLENDAGQIVTLRWSLSSAPVLAYDETGRLFVLYAGKVTRAATNAEREAYDASHWAKRAKGIVRGAIGAKKPLRRLGVGREIVYTTEKGRDRELVDYRHRWGEGASGKWRAPVIAIHECGAESCEGEGAIALVGGTYRMVPDRGIVG